MRIYYAFIAAVGIFAARTALANEHYTIDYIVGQIVSLVLNPLIMLLMVLGTVLFLWGLIEFIANPGNEEKRTTGKRHMVWGILGLFFMVSAWGIIKVLCNFFETCQRLGI